MKNTNRLLAGAAVVAIVAGLGGAASAVDDTKEVRQSDFIAGLSDTRSAGHVEFLEEGVAITTDDTSSNAKAAEYFAPRTAGGIPDSGSYVWNGTPGAPDSSLGQPGAQIVFDTDADGSNAGSFNVLVGEQVYSTNGKGQALTDWWYTGGAARAATRGFTCPETSGGSGSDCHGTLAQWQAAIPASKVTAYGFSLGSGVKGDGVLRSETFGGDEYIFTDEAATATPPPAPPTVNSTGTISKATAGRTIGYTVKSSATPTGAKQGSVPRWKFMVNTSTTSMQSPAAGTTGTFNYHCPDTNTCTYRVFKDGVEQKSMAVTIRRR